MIVKQWAKSNVHFSCSCSFYGSMDVPTLWRIKCDWSFHNSKVLDIWKSEANGLSACWPRAKPTQLRAQLLEINIRTSFSLLSFTHKHIGQWHLINDDFQEYKKRKFFHSNTFLILFLFCSISHSLLHFLFHSLSLSRCQWQIAID